MENEILIGNYSWADWSERCGWGNFDTATYIPDTSMLELLESAASGNDIEFLLFSGSWCGDSRSEVPKIYKLLNMSKISTEKIKLLGVGRDKREPSGLSEKFNIERVPTLIVLRNGVELGRVVEYPLYSWEADIFAYLSNK